MKSAVKLVVILLNHLRAEHFSHSLQYLRSIPVLAHPDIPIPQYQCATAASNSRLSIAPPPSSHTPNSGALPRLSALPLGAAAQGSNIPVLVYSKGGKVSQDTPMEAEARKLHASKLCHHRYRDKNGILRSPTPKVTMAHAMSTFYQVSQRPISYHSVSAMRTLAFCDDLQTLGFLPPALKRLRAHARPSSVASTTNSQPVRQRKMKPATHTLGTALRAARETPRVVWQDTGNGERALLMKVSTPLVLTATFTMTVRTTLPTSHARNIISFITGAVVCILASDVARTVATKPQAISNEDCIRLNFYTIPLTRVCRRTIMASVSFARTAIPSSVRNRRTNPQGDKDGANNGGHSPASSNSGIFPFNRPAVSKGRHTLTQDHRNDKHLPAMRHNCAFKALLWIPTARHSRLTPLFAIKIPGCFKITTLQ